MQLRHLPESSPSTVSGILLMVVIGAIGCGGQTETVDWLKNDGSYCSPSAQERTEECYVEPQEGNTVTIKNTDDLGRLCDSRCNKVRYLEIFKMEGLKDLQALTGIKIETSATIESNPDLESTMGLKMGDKSGLRLFQNPRLEVVSGLNEVQTLGEFVLEDSPNVEEVPDLPNLEKLSGDGEFIAKIQLHNTGVTNLDALDGLKLTESSHLWFQGNDSLTRLPEVSGEGLWVQIEDNVSLADVSGLKGISKIHGSLTVTGNKSLKNCQAQAVADAIVFTDRADLRIQDNASGSCSN